MKFDLFSISHIVCRMKLDLFSISHIVCRIKFDLFSISHIVCRMKLDLAGLSPTSRQRRLCEHRMTRLRHVTTSCREDMAELYFITSGSNVIDLPLFRRKPNQAFVNFLKEEEAPERVISEVPDILKQLFD